MSQGETKHTWILSDELKVLFIYLYDNDPDYTIDKIAEWIGVPNAKVKARIGNFKWVNGNGANGGLEHASHQTKFVFNQYRLLSREALKYIAFDYDTSIGSL